MVPTSASQAAVTPVATGTLSYNADSARVQTAVNGNEDEVEDESTAEDINEKLGSIWDDAKKGSELDKALEDTMALVSKQIEDLIRTGLEAFHRLENTSRELSLLKDQYNAKEEENERLRVAEEKSRVTVSVRKRACELGTETERYRNPKSCCVFCSYILQNLLRALEASRTETREQSRSAVSEAGLRAELSVMTSSRDEALGLAEESKRKSNLLQEELRQVKTKLSRVTQEKIKMERDHRATLSLAKSLDNQGSADVDYYKRKVSELSSHVQSLNASMAEKDRQLQEMRRQIERNMSQNRLANLRNNMDKDSRKRSRA